MYFSTIFSPLQRDSERRTHNGGVDKDYDDRKVCDGQTQVHQNHQHDAGAGRSSFSRTNGRLCGCPTVGKLRRIDAQCQLLPNFLSKTPEVDVAKWMLKIHIKRVEVSTDDAATWHEAQLVENRSPYVCTMWRYQFAPAKPGEYNVRVRATVATESSSPKAIRTRASGKADNRGSDSRSLESVYECTVR